MIIDVTQMQPGEIGEVTEIQGGFGAVSKIHGIGIRPGKEVTKVSSHFWRGPQTLAIGNLRVAVGFGMARKILVEVKR